MPLTSPAEVPELSIDQIALRIHVVRGQRVLLDTDLAAFYGETTKRLNQQVSRNKERFPEGFMFQLEAQESEALRLQIATLKPQAPLGRGQHRKYAPFAFTEHGAIMAAMVLKSARATALSVHVVRAFVALRGMVASNRELAQKVHSLERKVSVHERNIAQLADAMSELLAAPAPPSRPIGFVTPSPPATVKPKARRARKAP